MTKSLVPLLLFFFLFWDSWAQPLTKRTYEGTINANIPIVLTLTQDGQALFGTVVYKKKGIPLPVVGKLEEGTMFLHELMGNGNVTGIYSLSSKAGAWTGSWSAPKRDAKEMKVALQEAGKTSEPSRPLADVTGTYAYSFGKDQGLGEVLVQQLSSNKIILSANAVTAAPAYNMAVIEKITLSLRGNRAIYQTSDFGNCKMQFTFRNNTIQVDYLDRAYECGFGHNASVAGNYIRTKTTRPTFETP